ncbi:MAG: ABC transporter substrate-binding protein [Aliarcobacter sp.]|nr:ABC transporter substrate-binding protein [Aliarcobacter sp.]
MKKTSIQLMWLDQFEFAGFYVAKEKGYYQELGLDVEIKKFNSNIDLTQEVLDEKSDFGLNSSSLIVDKSEGKNILILGTIFQSSPLVLIALENSNINTFNDLKNKKIMITNNQENFAPLQSMLKSQNLQLSDFKFIPHSFNVDDLINKKTDLMAAYTTNEQFTLKEKDYKSKIFNPKDYGFDFYEDIIFTSKEFAQDNPETVKNFYAATIKGYLYAFEHIEEVAKLIHEKYNSQNKSLESLIFEANEMKKLVFDKQGNIGTVTPEKINLIVNTYRVMGLIKSEIKSEDFIYSKHLEDNFLLNKEEKTYLEKKESIKMCVDPDWMPFEKIEKNKHVGIAADYIKLIEKKINKTITLVPTKTWSESLEYGKNRACDIFSLVMKTPQREKYLNFTKPYLELPLVVAADINTPFVDNILQIKDKKLAMVKDYAFAEILESKYPDIQFINVQNLNEGLELVRKGQVYGFIDTLASIGYNIQNNYIGQLKIAGKFDETWELGIASRNDEPILNTIFNKAIKDISLSQKQEILNKWISINYQKKIDYTFFYKMLVTSIIIILIIVLIYRHYLLKKLNSQLNEKIELEIKKNEEKNRILIQQSRMASMGEMLENIAHQWRQPLSTISIAASGMEVKKEFSTLSDEEFYKSIDHIKKASMYLSQTIEDFRSFFNKKKTLSKINSKKVIDKTLELMGNTFVQNRITLINDTQEIETLSLENELIQVLMNIFANAKDALKQLSGDNKYIFINVFKEENNLIIQIKDSAGGIDDEIIDKIFEPYFTTKHQFNGTGIGLYMSKLLVERHLKGTLSARNVEFTFMEVIHKGALFEIVLPIS